MDIHVGSFAYSKFGTWTNLPCCLYVIPFVARHFDDPMRDFGIPVITSLITIHIILDLVLVLISRLVYIDDVM
jgi:hypothetical protein